MSSNLILFSLYIFIILILLCPLFYLVSLRLFRLFQFNELTFYIFFSDNLLKKEREGYMMLYRIYTKRKQWLLCIAMCEFYYFYIQQDNVVLCKYLALCYHNLSFLQLAEHCYLKYLKSYPSDISILRSLSKLYIGCDRLTEASEIKSRIFRISNNLI